MPNLYIPTQIVIQLENQIQPPQWQAPVLIAGVNVVTNDAGQALYQPAYSQRPMSSEEFDEGNLAAINAQLGQLGLEIRKVEVADDAANLD